MSGRQINLTSGQEELEGTTAIQIKKKSRGTNERPNCGVKKREQKARMLGWSDGHLIYSWKLSWAISPPSEFTGEERSQNSFLNK